MAADTVEAEMDAAADALVVFFRCPREAAVAALQSALIGEQQPLKAFSPDVV